MSFKDYRTARNESSPSTRNKWAAFLGLQPMYSADVFGHATPIAPVVDKLLDKLKDHKDKKEKDDKGDKKHKKKKESKKKKKDESSFHEEEKKPDRSFDAFIRKAEKAADDVEQEEDAAHKEDERLSKEIEKLSKKTDIDPKPPEKHDERDDDVVASLTKQAKKVSTEPKPEKIKAKPNNPPKPKTESFSQEESNEWDQIFSSSMKDNTEE